jgi:hypothetical protein
MIFSIEFPQVFGKYKGARVGARAGGALSNFGSGSRRKFNFGFSASALQHCGKL